MLIGKMENDLTTLKDTVAIASPLIKALIDTFVTPKLVSFREKFAISKEHSTVPTEEHFTEYYHRTYKRLAVINTMVFNNSQRFLTDIYLPLTISAKDPRLNKLKAKINGFPKKISDDYGNILITDTAGMGKSTLMKLIFLDIIDKNLGIPLFIELRRLSRAKKVVDEIKEQLSSINKNFNDELLLELLSEGDFIIILDGYDEIPLAERDQVTSDIQEFITKAFQNRFFITSRPENALMSFGNFKEFKIEPLTKKEAFELLRKYDNQGSISSLLIKKLEEDGMSNIEEFMTNPLLVSLLFTAFEHKQTIPFKKYLFYRQVYDANFELHDLTKGDSYTHNKYSKLEIDDFHRVLRHIGFNCFTNQTIEFSKDEILKLIAESKKSCVGLSFSESDFLVDIIKTVPLFTQDGNYYRWAHKSLQEYFAAQYIYLDSKERQSKILEFMYNSPKIKDFINVLDLYYDMDYKGFRNVVELSPLKEYEEHSIEIDRNTSTEIDETSKVTRKELSFLNDSYIFKSNSEIAIIDPDENMDKMINDLRREKYISNGVDLTDITIITKQDHFIYVNFEFSKFAILDLLRNKRSLIVKRFKPLDNHITSYLPSKQYNPELIILLKFHKTDKQANYDIVNLTLQDSHLTVLSINHSVAMQKLRDIKESMSYDETNDFFTSLC